MCILSKFFGALGKVICCRNSPLVAPANSENDANAGVEMNQLPTAKATDKPANQSAEKNGSTAAVQAKYLEQPANQDTKKENGDEVPDEKEPPVKKRKARAPKERPPTASPRD